MSARRAAFLWPVAFVAAAILLRVAAGAAASGFGAFEDEPAHLVTALMARDWLVQPDPLHPVRYAELYYQHYPKVAAGQWPPGLHGLLALWTLVFGASRLALMALPAACAGLAAWLVTRTLTREVGLVAATLAGTLLLVLPLVQVFSGAVMTEALLALLCTAALLAFGRFVEDGRARGVLLFGAFAVAALYVKGNAIALAGVPPVALLLARRPERLRSSALWLSGLLVGVAAAPWYVWTASFARGTWSGGGSPSLAYAREALPFYLREGVALGGGLVSILALVGFGARLADPSRRARWSALAAWPPCLLACHLLVPSSIEARHLVLLAPAWILAAGAGAHVAATRLAQAPRVRVAWATGLLALPIALHLAHFERKDWLGFDVPARALVSDPALSTAVLLVASDAAGEGLFVSEVALADPRRPSRTVLRASKVLGTSDWLGLDYHAHFQDTQALAAYLAELPVAVLAFDRSTRAEHWFVHHDLLAELLADADGAWELAGRHDLVRDGVRYTGALEVWVQPRAIGRKPRELTLDEVLQRDLSF